MTAIEEPAREPLAPGVYIVGLGIPEKSAATVDAIDVLRRCDVVFATDPNDVFYRTLCRDARTFGNIGSNKGPEATREAARKVAAEAEPGKSVAFAIYGHPMLYEPVCGMVADEARKRGVAVTIVPGVSALDAALALLQSPLVPDTGLQVGDIQFFLQRGAAEGCALFIYKAGMVPERLTELLALLVKARGAKAKAAVVEGKNFQNMTDTIEWTTLGALAKKKELPYYASLFVPA